MNLDGEAWKRIFSSLENICKESKLKEFQFKPSHRIVITKRELFRYRIKTDDECPYSGDHDSIDHTFKDCEFVKRFVKKFIDWFNVINNSNLIPTIEEKLLGIMSDPYDKALLEKFNYTTLFMRYYIHTCKMHNKATHVSTVVDKVLCKYRIQTFS